jgi:SHS2 domain-containing protein
VRSCSRAEEHTGEWKVTVWADTLPGVFTEVARVIARTGGGARGTAGRWEPVAVASRDTATLLVDWANELLGRSEVRRRAYRDVRHVRVGGARLTSDVRGRPVAEWRSSLKAATYHGVSLARRGKRWKAVMLFDV